TTTDPADDDTLSALAREGDGQAFAELYRRHLAAAKSTARRMTRSRDDVEDVVAEAFTGVLNALRNGRGPTDNFRAYLLACVRNGCYVRRRPPLAIDTDELEAASPPALEDPEKYVEADTVARAFASLSPRWQRTLWLTEVEQRPAAEVGERMQLAPNATAALSRRARQAFAAAYLSQHVADLAGVGCGPIAPRLGAYVRDTLRPSERAEVAAHLESCAGCSRAVDELSDLNASLRTLQMPITAVGGGAAAVATGITVSTTAGVGGTWAAMLGAGALTKIAAVALVVVPAVALGINRATESTPVHQDLTPAQVLAPPNGTVPRNAAITSVTTTIPSPNDAPGALPSGATSGPSGDVSMTGPDGLPVAGVVPAATVPVPGAAGTGTGSTAVGAAAVGAATLPGGGVLPAVTGPGSSVPAGSVPPIFVPPISVPAVQLPVISLPPINVPPVQLPVISAPPIDVPGLPAISLPAGSVAPVVPPAVTVPVVSVPPITVPPITVPPVQLPVVTIPAVTVPAVVPPAPTLPSIPPIVPRLGRGG
ncbi:MAG: sigma-70 family RNA polymerase sigma factor, partial [Ilumatobacteraceae bacterium]